MVMAPDITVIIATYNRAQELARTLEGMAKTENGGLSVEFVVVDNGSIDDTKEIIASFNHLLRITYVFTPEEEKNAPKR